MPTDLPQRWAALEEQHVRRATSGEVTWQEQRRHRLAGLLPALGLETGGAEDLDAHFADFLTHYERAWTAYDDVAGALTSWRRARVRLAVLTNGVKEQQERKLAAIGVLDDLELVVALDDLGVGKPDPRAYHEAC